MNFKKVDENGFYCPFRGVTVVCAWMTTVDHMNVDNSTADYEDESGNQLKPMASMHIQRKIFNYLSNHSLLAQYYAPLPFESYHMTTMDLITIRDTSVEGWVGYIDQNLSTFQHIFQVISNPANVLFPVVSVASFVVSTVILLILKVDDSQIIIEQVAEELNLKNKIPKEFHFTLAYQFKPIPADHLTQIKLDFAEFISQLYSNGDLSNIQLHQPKLCSFEDMTLFTPWTAETNPFLV
eukprot:gene8603-11627_t